ncbi:carbohydrate ABC transporter permease [Sorangium sp. So ce128]|uniref:carbohydrate ABC transporter permease n=1 Tax=Sorangium sp. So ce128 TaxID=3133281 RepID=UPI003F5ED699
MKKQIPRARAEARWGCAFVAVPVLGFVVFALGPMLASLYLSFTRFEVLTPPRWVGLDNYARLFARDFFVWRTLANTAFYLLGIPIGIAISLLLALLLNQKLRLEGFFRTVFFIPSVCSIVAAALLWKWIYNADYGLINTYLRALGVADPPGWLSSPHLVKPALVVMGIWSGLGYNMVLFLAALQGVPRSLLEAAELDGANAWQRFRHVTLPAISPMTFFIAVTSVIGGLQSFDQVYVMTRGGPEFRSATFMLYLYLTGFQYFQMGYASAMAWVLGALVMIVTVLQFRLARRWVHDE